MNDSCCDKSSDSEILAIKQHPKWLRMAFALVILTIIYNIFEAVVAVYTGYTSESIALLGFGFDGFLELSAASLMLWRLIEQVKHNNDDAVERAEMSVHRYVGATFILLALYIGYNAVTTLCHQTKPEETMVGIILAALSLLVMPALAWGKLRAAKELKSNALHSEAKETIACSILSLILLIGLGLNALFGWWWADPVSALIMIPWLVKEGVAGLKGQSCCD